MSILGFFRGLLDRRNLVAIDHNASLISQSCQQKGDTLLVVHVSLNNCIEALKRAICDLYRIARFRIRVYGQYVNCFTGPVLELINDRLRDHSRATTKGNYVNYLVREPHRPVMLS